VAAVATAETEIETVATAVAAVATAETEIETVATAVAIAIAGIIHD
jgi:hypothetical protein